MRILSAVFHPHFITPHFIIRILSLTFYQGPFTWKEDDPSAGIILALGSSERGMFSAFSLHVKGCIWPQC